MSYLFVGNLSKNVSEKALHNLFSKCGLCAVELKGPYAFVRYSSVEESSKAKSKFNNTNLEGINGNNKTRIEFSKKGGIDDFLAGKVITQRIKILKKMMKMNILQEKIHIIEMKKKKRKVIIKIIKIKKNI